MRHIEITVQRMGQYGPYQVQALMSPSRPLPKIGARFVIEGVEVERIE